MFYLKWKPISVALWLKYKFKKGGDMRAELLRTRDNHPADWPAATDVGLFLGARAFVARYLHIAAAASAVCLTLCGCAKVSITPLKPDGTPSGEAEGIRYYVPKPYLLVMNLSGGSGGGASPPAAPVLDPKTGKPIGQPGGGDTSTQTGGGGTGTTAPSASGDTSFMAADTQTVAKIIYLPDYSRPMAVSEFPGLFGTSTMSASLQDGWMLTTLQGSGDSKTAETLTALGSLVSAVGGVVSGGGAAKSAVKAPGGPGGQAITNPLQLLPPGLYSPVYNPAGVFDRCVFGQRLRHSAKFRAALLLTRRLLRNL
jgi:hypothetical protein